MEQIIERVIDGKLYKARFKGMRYAYDLGNFMKKKRSTRQLTKILFDEILVNTDVKIDGFENLHALEEVRAFLLDVALGEFEDIPSERKIQNQVKEEWACWRLIYNDISSFDIDTVFNKMTPLEIKKANVALDIVIENINKKTNSKQTRG